MVPEIASWSSRATASRSARTAADAASASACSRAAAYDSAAGAAPLPHSEGRSGCQGDGHDNQRDLRVLAEEGPLRHGHRDDERRGSGHGRSIAHRPRDAGPHEAADREDHPGPVTAGALRTTPKAMMAAAKEQARPGLSRHSAMVAAAAIVSPSWNATTDEPAPGGSRRLSTRASTATAPPTARSRRRTTWAKVGTGSTGPGATSSPEQPEQATQLDSRGPSLGLDLAQEGPLVLGRAGARPDAELFDPHDGRPHDGLDVDRHPIALARQCLRRRLRLAPVPRAAGPAALPLAARAARTAERTPKASSTARTEPNAASSSAGSSDIRLRAQVRPVAPKTSARSRDGYGSPFDDRHQRRPCGSSLRTTGGPPRGVTARCLAADAWAARKT